MLNRYDRQLEEAIESARAEKPDASFFDMDFPSTKPLWVDLLRSREKGIERKWRKAK